MKQNIYAAYINGPELLVFTDSTHDRIKQDVMASTLYAQLAADRQFNKFTHHRQWQAALLKARHTFGWLRLDLESVEGGWVDSPTFSPLDIINELLPARQNPWPAATLEHLTASLFASPQTAPAAALLKHSLCRSVEADCHDTGAVIATASVVLQMGVVLPGAEKVSICVAFETTEPIAENPFAQRFSRHSLVGDIKCWRLIDVLDDLRYSPFRQRITEALQDRREELILPIDGLES